jgi:hypothetical protein
MIHQLYNTLSTVDWERVWARSTGHLIGNNDHDEPTVPILTRVEARLSLVFRTGWVVVHLLTCLFVVLGVIHKW